MSGLLGATGIRRMMPGKRTVEFASGMTGRVVSLVGVAMLMRDYLPNGWLKILAINGEEEGYMDNMPLQGSIKRVCSYSDENESENVGCWMD